MSYDDVYLNFSSMQFTHESRTVSDDIVLQLYAAKRIDWSHYSAPAIAELFDNAIHEIERLRHAGDSLALAYRHMGGLDAAHDAPLKVWEVVRRG